MKKLICTVLTVLLLFYNQLNASEKNKIIENLKKINSLQFNLHNFQVMDRKMEAAF